jgi:hypothetical protein
LLLGLQPLPLAFGASASGRVPFSTVPISSTGISSVRSIRINFRVRTSACE